MRKISVVLLVVVGLLLFVLPSAYAASYQTTVAAKARSCPKVSCGIVTTLAKNTVIDVIETVEGDKFNGITQWLHIKVNGRDAYVHASLAKPTTAAALPAAGSGSGSSNTTSPTAVPNTTIPTQEAPPPQSLICGNCSSFSSCDQARACLSAGHSDLDRDHDGIPCESICGG